MKLHVNYTVDGFNHSDFEALEIVKGLVEEARAQNSEIHLKTTNANVVYAARVLLKEGFISKNEVAFLYNHLELNHDSNGEFENYPDGFLDISTKLLMRLI